MKQNDRAAYLGYLQNMLYAEGEELRILKGIVDEFQKAHPSECRKIVIIASADDRLERVQVCLESIYKYTNSLLCEIVCLVQSHQKEVKEWLEQQAVKVLQVETWDGYANVRNKILQEYEQEDIFLLSANCALLPNAIYNMAMTLAERDAAGMVAASDYQKARTKSDIYVPGTEEKQMCFNEASGILIRRECLNELGKFDEKLATEKYGIIDLAMGSLMQNYENLVSKQSFIFRIVQDTIDDTKAWADVEYLVGKWGIDIEYYSMVRTDLISMMAEEQAKPIRVLEIGCGAGATLLQIKRQFPNAQVYGLELQDRAVDFGSKILPITCGNIEDRKLDFPKEYFDYILLGDVLEHLVNPEDTLVYLKQFLKSNGYILTSIPNLQHFSAFIPLLFGEFEYFDAGVMDRTHLRFFTLRSIQNMFERIHCEIVEMKQNVDVSAMQPWVEQIINQLCAISSEIDRQGFLTLQYCVKARKC